MAKYKRAERKMRAKIDTVGAKQRAIIKDRVLNKGLTIEEVSRFILKSTENQIGKMYTARKAVNFIICEEKLSTRLEWLKKAEDSLSEEELFKIPLNPLWKLPY